MQNDDLPELLGPFTTQENECLNLRTSHMDCQAVKTLLSPFSLHYLYSNGIHVLSPNQRLLKKEIIHSSYSGYLTIDTVHRPFLLRLIFISVSTVTVVGSPYQEYCP